MSRRLARRTNFAFGDWVRLCGPIGCLCDQRYDAEKSSQRPTYRLISPRYDAQA